MALFFDSQKSTLQGNEEGEKKKKKKNLVHKASCLFNFLLLFFIYLGCTHVSWNLSLQPGLNMWTMAVKALSLNH